MNKQNKTVDVDFNALLKEKHVSPLNFDMFIPWACFELGFSFIPIINNISKSQSASTARTIPKSIDGTDAENIKDNFEKSSAWSSGDVVAMSTLYDNFNHLVEIKFHKNKEVPRALLKIISLALPFHTYLTAIHIEKGLKPEGLYELSKIVSMSNITDIILDNTVIKEANYYLLLEDKSCLKYLSLARCQINDDVVKTIATRLVYPLTGSKSLTVLNLSSNAITDCGARYLANALRTNRKLSYLNLSGNMITDIGADSIFSILMEFRLTCEELKDSKQRHFVFLKDIENLKKLHAEKPYLLNSDKKTMKKKTAKLSSSSTSRKNRPLEIDTDRTDLTLPNINELYLDSAKFNFEDLLGQFKDPFQSSNTVSKNGVVFCLGNNTLSYISLAYNNLSYFTVKRLYNVICTQSSLNRKPKGLINVCIEGNAIPNSCEELKEIQTILEHGLASAWKLNNYSKNRRTK